MKVAIHTTFGWIDPAYSLSRVVKDQLVMLLKNGIEVVLLAHESLASEGKRTGVWAIPELRKFPGVYGPNDPPDKLPSRFEPDVEKIYQLLKEYLKDCTLCITHDIVYQNAHMVHNVAARKLAKERNDLRWLHWIHSATRPNPPHLEILKPYGTHERFPNSFLVFPNIGDRKRVATNFRMEIDEVKVVPHSIDIYEHFKFHPLSIEITEKYGLLDTDVLMIYPVRLDRGKNPHVLLSVIDRLRNKGKNAKALIFDFSSTGGDKVDYRNEMMQLAAVKGISDSFIFISQHSEKTEHSVPHEVITDMFNISNVFLHTTLFISFIPSPKYCLGRKLTPP